MWMYAYMTLLFGAANIRALHDVQVLNLFKNTYSGESTFYGNTPSGLCTLNIPSLPDVAKRVDVLVALNRPQMFGSSACGMCVKITGDVNGLGNNPASGEIFGYVKDQCRGCKSGSLKIAKTGDGRWNVTMQAVQCPVNSPIQYTMQGSNNYYIKIQTRNERFPTTTLEMWQPKSEKWLTMSRTRDGYWSFPSSPDVEKPISRPFKVRLTAPNGEGLVDELNPPSMGYTGIINGVHSVQYAYDKYLPSAPIVIT